MSTSEYYLKRNEESYNFFKEGKLFEKVRCLIVKDNKILFLKKVNFSKNALYVLPGGGVEVGESLIDAAKRESLEEAGAIIKVKNLLCSSKYETLCEFNNFKFKSKRIEHFFLCEYIEKVSNVLGIEGEFNCKIKVVWENFDILSKIRIRANALNCLMKALKENI